jgi:hypothetical protein
MPPLPITPVAFRRGPIQHRAGRSRVLLLAVFAAAATKETANLGFAQAPDPSAAPAPAPAATSEKAAISKACSDLANQQGLKGKKRKKFRAACKKNGGKAPDAQ